ncbi:antitoxin VbhA family protein [Hymenobacter monticola]|uniref:Antitoxin VbhA family protein n=1 Tax=Hymenobacter monticola TaxID=1705399 RepID=A0ABY4AZ12_9BACT|nr:antitoxin VbhA family protein [Hymenobacter monticola]UOE32104.1 antitoxin VbhA family protein [Hymenobacter monticola]
MFAYLFGPVPDDLSPDQRAHWQRRQATARNTLEIQALTGTVASAETVAFFERYVRGEVTLAQAIAQVREQIAQEHHSYRQFLNRRNII